MRLTRLLFQKLTRGNYRVIHLGLIRKKIIQPVHNPSSAKLDSNLPGYFFTQFIV